MLPDTLTTLLYHPLIGFTPRRARTLGRVAAVDEQIFSVKRQHEAPAESQQSAREHDGRHEVLLHHNIRQRQGCDGARRRPRHGGLTRRPGFEARNARREERPTDCEPTDQTRLGASQDVTDHA